MKPCVMVIGVSNSGKSTIIASLTGCESHNTDDIVKDKANGKKIYVVASSPQEDQQFSLRNLNKALRIVTQKQDIIGLVMAIQPNNPRIRLTLESIVQSVQETNVLNIYAFVLDPPYKGKPVDRTQLRSRLRDLGIVPRYLDARQFALINSIKIKRVTGIP